MQLAEPYGDGHGRRRPALEREARGVSRAAARARTGSLQSFDVAPAEWAESASLSRFRLHGNTLYQLRSDPLRGRDRDVRDRRNDMRRGLATGLLGGSRARSARDRHAGRRVPHALPVRMQRHVVQPRPGQRAPMRATTPTSPPAEGYQWGGGCWNGEQRRRFAGRSDRGPEHARRGRRTARASRSSRGGSAPRPATPGSATTRGCRTSTAPTPRRTSRPAPALRTRPSPRRTRRTWTRSRPAYHIGMIYWANTAFNQDRIIEAKCEACGTGTWPRTYRGNPDYSGVRRLYWAG